MHRAICAFLHLLLIFCRVYRFNVLLTCEQLCLKTYIRCGIYTYKISSQFTCSRDWKRGELGKETFVGIEKSNSKFETNIYARSWDLTPLFPLFMLYNSMQILCSFILMIHPSQRVLVSTVVYSWINQGIFTLTFTYWICSFKFELWIFRSFYDIEALFTLLRVMIDFSKYERNGHKHYGTWPGTNSLLSFILCSLIIIVSWNNDDDPMKSCLLWWCSLYSSVTSLHILLNSVSRRCCFKMVIEVLELTGVQTAVCRCV